MKKLLMAAIGTMAGAACASITTELDEANDRYLVTVSNHETSNVLSASQIAELGSHTLVKLGSGTLYGKGELKDFTGDIIISNGYFNISHTNALGTAAGETYVDGGTLITSVGGGRTDCTRPTFPNEKLHLKGTGDNNNGALQVKYNDQDSFRYVTLEGDATINLDGRRLDFRCTAIDMKGHDLTLRGGGEMLWVIFYIYNAGNVWATDRSQFELQGNIYNGKTCKNKKVTLESGTKFRFWNLSDWSWFDFDFAAGSSIVANSGAFKLTGDNRNVFGGKVELGGVIPCNIASNRQVQARGKVTGDGGFAVTSGGYLQILPNDTSITNDFAGGVSATGLAGGDEIVGGIVVNSDRAIPTDGGALALTNANFWIHNTTAKLALPDLVADGSVKVMATAADVAISTAKSLTKTGEGVMTISTPLKIVGNTEVKGGTLCFGRKVPYYKAGLHYAYNKNTWRSNPTEIKPTDIVNRSDYKGVDGSGAYYAYNWWPTGERGNANHYYSGYFKVPGEEGTDKRCRFISCVKRQTGITIDGTRVLFVDDNKVTTPANGPQALGWTRHYWSDPITLKAGWHRLFVSMESHDTAHNDGGPQSGVTSYIYGLWPGFFGAGVDFNSSATLANKATNSYDTASGTWIYEDRITNSTSYVKFQDSGDGSFLRSSTNINDKLNFNADNYWPSFGGSVAFAGGTTLDLNDYEPYSVLTIPSLIGLPTITNGSVKVTSTTWQLRGSDLASGEPLTITANAVLQFGDVNSEVTITGDAEDWRSTLRKAHKSLSAKIVSDNGATAIKNTFVLDPSLTNVGWELTKNGSEWTLSRNLGLMLILK